MLQFLTKRARVRDCKRTDAISAGSHLGDSPAKQKPCGLGFSEIMVSLFMGRDGFALEEDGFG